MKKRSLMIAGMISGCIMLTMGSAVTAGAQERTAQKVASEAASEHPEDTEKASENPENKEEASGNQESKEEASGNQENKEEASEKQDNKETADNTIPSMSRGSDRSMQPPKEGSQDRTQWQDRPERQQMTGNEGGETQPEERESGKPALPERMTPNENSQAGMPNENSQAGAKPASGSFRPNEKPYDKVHDPADRGAMRNDNRAQKNENHKAPQSESQDRAPQEQNGQAQQGRPQGGAPQGQLQDQQPQGGAPQGQLRDQQPQGGAPHGQLQNQQPQGGAPQEQGRI